jgi:probable DNA metabolism protein
MRVYVYDKSFEGLLSAVFDAYLRRIFPDLLVGEQEVPPLLAAGAHTVCVTREKAERVAAGLKKRLSRSGYGDLLRVWLSEQEGCEMLLLRYLRKIFDSPYSVERNFADKDVSAVAKLAGQVGTESHLMCGFARFQKTAEGIYCAVIGPRYNVLPLMLSHFTERFGDQRWALYDAKRGYGVLAAGDEGFREITPDAGYAGNGRLKSSLLADGELLFQNLWKSYHRAVSIEERRNPMLQRNCMPKRFWAYMTEKQ